MLYTGYQHPGPAAVRYPRGIGSGVEAEQTMQLLAQGKARIVRNGEKLAILAFGPLLHQCQAVAAERNATLVDMRFIKPLDEAMLLQLVADHSHFVTIEDNALIGGAGSAVNDVLLRQGCNVKVLNLGLPDQFVKHGSQQEIYAELGLDSEGISKQISAFLKR